MTLQAERAKHPYENASRSPEYVAYNNSFVDRTFNARPFQTVVDFACGAGVITQRVRDRLFGLDASIIGIDPNPASIQTAKRDVASVGKTKVGFFEGDAEFLAQLPRVSVDTVYFANAIHELPGRDVQMQALHAIASVLKPDGKLFVNSAYTAEWTEGLADGEAMKWGKWKMKALNQLGKRRDKNAPKFKELPTADYMQMMEEAGLVVGPSNIHTEIVTLSSDFLRAISHYDTFASGVFMDMQDTDQFTLEEKTQALIAAMDEMEQEYREKTGNPQAVLTFERNWVEITAQKPELPLAA